MSSKKYVLHSISKAYLSYMFVPSKHIHPICQSCSLCLVVIDLTATSRTGCCIYMAERAEKHPTKETDEGLLMERL